jgi:epoxyqueuosine reductase QueG
MTRVVSTPPRSIWGRELDACGEPTFSGSSKIPIYYERLDMSVAEWEVFFETSCIYCACGSDNVLRNIAVKLGSKPMGQFLRRLSVADSVSLGMA